MVAVAGCDIGAEAYEGAAYPECFRKWPKLYQIVA